MTVTLTPATEQVLRARNLHLIPRLIPGAVAVAVFAHERDSIISDLKDGREIHRERLDALNALNRELHDLHKAFEFKSWHNYRIINRYLCSGHRTERGTVVWMASGDLIPVLEDLTVPH